MTRFLDHSQGQQRGTLRLGHTHAVHTLRRDRPYEHKAIAGLMGLTDAQGESPLDLGAVER